MDVSNDYRDGEDDLVDCYKRSDFFVVGDRPISSFLHWHFSFLYK